MEDECQNCRRSDYGHQSKMHYADCGHSLEHSRGYHCTVCKKDLGRAEFFDKPKDEREYERQRHIRQKVLAMYTSLSFNEEEEDFPSREEYDRHLEKVEELIERFMVGQNIPVLHEELEMHEKENQSKIVARKIRRENAKRALRREAIIEDSIYDESKRTSNSGEEAQILRREIEEEEDSKKHKAKEMPECENIDSVGTMQSCDLSQLEENLRKLFLQASGCDFGVKDTCGREELRDGLCAPRRTPMDIDS